MSYREQEEEQTLDEFLRRENANDVIDDATRLQSLSNRDITFDQALVLGIQKNTLRLRIGES